MGTVRQIVKSGIDPLTIDTVFITHRHADHITGVAHFLFIRLISDSKAKVRVLGPLNALKVIEKIVFLTHDFLFMNKQRIAFVPLRPGQKVTPAPGLSVTTCKVSGPSGRPLTTFGYRITAGTKNVVFTADMSPSPGFDRFAKDADILIHECFGLEKDKNVFIKFGHSSARDAGICAQKARVKQLILTHLPQKRVVAAVELVNEARRFFRGSVIAAEDGMEIKL